MATGHRSDDQRAYDAQFYFDDPDLPPNDRYEDGDDDDAAPIRTITAPGRRSCGHAHHLYAPVGTRVACHDCAAEAREEARDESRTREKR